MKEIERGMAQEIITRLQMVATLPGVVDILPAAGILLVTNTGREDIMTGTTENVIERVDEIARVEKTVIVEETVIEKVTLETEEEEKVAVAEMGTEREEAVETEDRVMTTETEKEDLNLTLEDRMEYLQDLDVSFLGFFTFV